MILEAEQMKLALVNIVNGAIQKGVPCYVIEPIVKDILSQVSAIKEQEIQHAAQEAQNANTESGCQHE